MPKAKKLMRRGRHMPKLNTCKEIDNLLRRMRDQGVTSTKGSRWKRDMGRAARACRTGHADMMVMYLIEAGAHW
jgi:hypothetical protein